MFTSVGGVPCVWQNAATRIQWRSFVMGKLSGVRGFGVRNQIIGALIGALIGLAGCEVGPDYHTPKVPTPARYTEAEARPTSRPAPGLAEAPTDAELKRWWETFRDPELNRLVDRGIKSNLDIQSAAERIVQARLEAGIARAGIFPTLNAVGQYNHSRRSAHLGSSSGSNSSPTGTTGTGTTTTTTSGSSSGANLEGDFYQAGFDSIWEIDLFGGIRRGIEAANANIDVAVEDRRSVLIT